MWTSKSVHLRNHSKASLQTCTSSCLEMESLWRLDDDGTFLRLLLHEAMYTPWKYACLVLGRRIRLWIFLNIAHISRSCLQFENFTVQLSDTFAACAEDMLAFRSIARIKLRQSNIPMSPC